MIVHHTDERILPLRMRSDLSVQRQWFGGEKHVVVKDPVANRYFWLRDDEFAVLQWLDGEASLAGLQARFNKTFAPRRLKTGHLQQFLAKLHRSGLIISEVAGQGSELWSRSRQADPHVVLKLVRALFQYRFRGIDPTRWLAMLDPFGRLLFSYLAVSSLSKSVFVALWLALASSSRLERELHDWSQFATSGAVFGLALALMIVKTLHEFGHALACRRWGGECREMGVQLFFCVPCLYSNVSDAWLLPSKWQRIAVSAAGMYVELWIAITAFTLWFWTEPGAIHGLALNVMVVCSVGTLLFNANPLMRYDGYYIFSDLIETPNLEQRSRTSLASVAAASALGVDLYDENAVSWKRRAMFAAWGLASQAYRIGVLVVVFAGIRRALNQWGLAPLADVLAVAILTGLAPIAIATFKMTSQEAALNHRWQRRRIVTTAGCLIAVATLLALAPLPSPLRAIAELEAENAESVYVTAAGRVVRSASPGERVAAGQVVGRLENPELELEFARLTGDRDRQKLLVALLEAQQNIDAAATSPLPTARESLRDLDRRVADLQSTVARLELKATRAGIVLPPPRSTSAGDAKNLHGWSGCPTDRENLGAYLEVGALFCQIGDPKQLQAVAAIDQGDVERIQPGQRVAIRPGAGIGGAMEGKVAEVARVDAEQLPSHLVATGEVEVRPGADGQARLQGSKYQVRIDVDPKDQRLLPGSLVKVRIAAKFETVLERSARWLRQLFRLPV